MRKKIFTFLLALVTSVGLSWAVPTEFANCYDCWRSPNYPNISGQCHLFNFGNPGVGNKNPSGPWKLEFVEYYNSSSTEYDDIVSSYAASQYGKSPEQMEVYRLYQWQNGAYQPVAYGVLYAYANESNPVEHAAFFEANGYWGCYLTGNTHSNGDDFNITFNEDAATGFADLHGSTPTPTPSGDKLPGVFSVSADKAVNFSKGNLQYDSDNQIWQFAANQWDYIGNAAGNNAITSDGIADNNGIVDLFCWVGASSSLEGIKQYGIISSFSGYGSVAGEALKSDWGNIMGGDWRTLSKDEWIYLLTERTNAANLRTLGTVNGKAGLILMPDGWTASGVALTVTTANYTTNDINTTNWATLEGQGCAFLPAAGCCMLGLFDGVGGDGSYWSSTSRASGATHAHRLHFRATDVDPTDFVERFTGMSVRLVSETAPSPAPAPAGLQVTELQISASWENDQTLVTISDLPGFVAVSLEEAGAWDAVPAGDVVLIYAGTNEGVTATYFHNGAWGDPVPFGGFSRADIFEWASGSKIFYTSGGSTPTPSGDEGKLLGAFTINSNGDQIVFSKGNLQYHCTNHVWQFATNQYDMIGGDNANISDSYDGWIDLFGYGTGNNPTLVSTSYGDYSTFTDWGVNAISNGGNEANQWRTLTSTEWLYMFRLRPEAHNKYGAATVANVPGIIVLPDVYVGPAINTVRDAWDNNVISSSEWAAYEAAGAVFLPAAGYRSGTTMYNVGSEGFCWSSTPDPGDAEYSYKLCLSPISVIEPQGFGRRNEGISVRLIKAASAQDIADVVIALINAIPNPVAYNDECKDAIDAARAAYDALTDAQKDLVENYGDLLDAETAYAQSIPHPNGECGAQGNNLLWDLDPSTGVLTITGSGAMNDWPDDTQRPWYDNRLQITSVVLPSGITSIGEKAFRGCNNLASINMTENYPAGLTAINQEAFCNTKLTSVTIPESVVTIGMDAFYLSQAITDVYCYADPNNLTWNDYYRDDFKKTPAKSTQCHVKDCHLDVFNTNWNTGNTTDVNVTFVGDLPGECGGSTPAVDPAVQNVIDLINAIPNPVAYNDECKNAIDAARAAYDALNADQKALVSNYSTLTDAEDAYAALIPVVTNYSISLDGITENADKVTLNNASAAEGETITLTPAAGYQITAFTASYASAYSVRVTADPNVNVYDATPYVGALPKEFTENVTPGQNGATFHSIEGDDPFTPVPASVLEYVGMNAAKDQMTIRVNDAFSGIIRVNYTYNVENCEWDEYEQQEICMGGTALASVRVVCEAAGGVAPASKDAVTGAYSFTMPAGNVTITATVEAIPAPTAAVIGDPNNASEVETFLTTYDGQTIDELIIDRPVYNNMYNTLCLPFDMNAAQIAASSLNGVIIREFTGASVVGQTLELAVSDPVNAVVAGRPYFVQYSAASQLDDLHFEGVTINNAVLDDEAITFDGVTFKGTFTPFVMPNGLNFQGGYLFLGQNNQLFWPNTPNPLKPFRAYFYVNVEASTPGNAPKYRGMPARIVEGKNVATGVENAQSANQSTKVIVNGQLIIIKNDVRYNAQGQIVK